MKYYVNKNPQPNLDHEVHKEWCYWLSLIAKEDRIDLWDFDNCKSAVTKAKTYYTYSDGCAHCCPGCHTS